MKKYFILSVLCLSSFLLADFAVEEIFSISYERSNITINNGSDVATGIDNFCISGDNLYLLNSVENTVYQYSLSSKKLIAKTNVPAFSMDIAVYNDVIFVLGTDNKLHILNQREVSSYKIIDSFAQGLHLIDGSPVIHLANGTTYNPISEDKKISNGWQFEKNASIYTEKISENMGRVTVTLDGKIRIFDVPTIKELGSIVAVGLNDTEVFVRLEILESSAPIQVTQKIICIDMQNRNGMVTTDIPNIQSNFSYNDCKYVDGNVVKMMLTPNSVDLVSLDSNNDGNSWKYNYTHDYNENLLQIEEAVVEADVNVEEPKTRISRSQILWNANDYLSVSWNCTSKNKTGLKTLPDGSKIRTPSWVTSGYHYKVPYKWGGHTSASAFKQKTSEGKYAGSSYTKSVSWGDRYCVGVDCSGFVSRAWGTSKKYGTSTIGQISTILSSVSKLKKGDALNKRGSHIVLVAENNPSGTVSVIEAAGIDWAVSKRTRSLSSLSRYKPISYDNVSEWK